MHTSGIMHQFLTPQHRNLRIWVWANKKKAQLQLKWARTVPFTSFILWGRIFLMVSDKSGSRILEFFFQLFNTKRDQQSQGILRFYEKKFTNKKGRGPETNPELCPKNESSEKPSTSEDLSSWQDKSSSQKGWVSIDRSMVAALPSTTPRPAHKSSTDDLGSALC